MKHRGVVELLQLSWSTLVKKSPVALNISRVGDIGDEVCRERVECMCEGH